MQNPIKTFDERISHFQAMIITTGTETCLTVINEKEIEIYQKMITATSLYKTSLLAPSWHVF